MRLSFKNRMETDPVRTGNSLKEEEEEDATNPIEMLQEQLDGLVEVVLSLPTTTSNLRVKERRAW